MSPEQEAEKILKKKWAEGEIRLLIQQSVAFRDFSEAKKDMEDILKAMQDDLVIPEEATSNAQFVYKILEEGSNNF